MFIGHFAVALGAKKAAPRTSLGTLVLAAQFADLHWIIRRYTRGTWIVGAAVVSHWGLDLIVHRPDLPLFPGGGPRLGLGLWNSLPATLAAEFGLFILGIGLYLNASVARDAVGRYAFWAFVVSLGALYLAASFGPPPPSVTALATTGLAGWLWVLWGYWIDRHREAARASGPPC